MKESVRQWTSFMHLDLEAVLNPMGDANGDGPASLGTSPAGVLVAPTIAWAKLVTPGNHDPVYAQFVEGAWTEPVVIGSSPRDDADPILHQDQAGMVHAVWGRGASDAMPSEILYASRPAGSAEFSPEQIVSLGGETARAGTLAVLPDGQVLVGYEVLANEGMRQVIVATKADPTSVFHGSIITATRFDSPRPELASKLGHTWITWIESDRFVGYSELIDGVWSLPAYEAYFGESSGKARMTIQTNLVDRRTNLGHRIR